MKLRKIFIFFVLCLLFSSCKKAEEQSKTFYYDVYSSKKKVNAYYKIVSTYQQKIRIDTIYRFNLDGKKVDEEIEKYVVAKDTLYKLSFDNKRYPYLIVDEDKCNLINLTEEVKTCLISNKEYLTFTEQMLVTDGVSKKLTFDKEFNLVENEYLDGYLSYYKIVRRKHKPDVL